MTSAVKVSHTVSHRYALALIDLADSQKALDAVAGDLQNILSVLNESAELNNAIQSPSTTPKQAEKIINLLAGQIGAHKLTANFLNVLVMKRRLPALKAMIEAAENELAKRRGEMNIEVKTAQDMTPDQVKALKDALSSNLGRKVAIHATVEPSILGGMIVTVGSQMIDDSVARKLQRLQAAMSGKANQNTTDILTVRKA